jgi:GT2 family glycosyltransferase
MPSQPPLSVVVVSLNEGASLRKTTENLLATLPPESEIVIVDDGSDDGSADFAAMGGGSARNDRTAEVRLFRTSNLGVARARNFGARQTTASTVIFVDAHMELPDGWWPPLFDAVHDAAVGAAAPGIAVAGDPHLRGFGLRFEAADLEIEWLDQYDTEPYDVPILPGCCLAMRRDVFDATGGFDDGMIRSGGVDNELAVRLWLLGYSLRIVPQVTVIHMFREQHPYPISWRTVLHNKLRLARIHFGAPRFEEVTDALREQNEYPEALVLIVDSDIESRRREVTGRRVRDDEWYFGRFTGAW